MVRLEKHGDSAVRFIFTDSDHYLYKNGVVDVPVNSLSLVIDESEMVTFKKASTADPFISFRLDKSNFSSRDELLTFYKENMVGAEGLSEEEVQEMIDAATSGIPSSEVVEQLRRDVNTVSGEVDTKQDILTAGENITISGNVISADAGNNIIELTQAEYDALETKDPEALYIITDAQEINMNDYYTKSEVDASIATKADTSAVTAVSGTVSSLSGEIDALQGDISALSEQVATKVETSDFNAYSAATDARIAEDEEVTAAALNDLAETVSGKQDTLISGENIKTINNISILGAGNITVSGGGGDYQYYSEDTTNESATIEVGEQSLSVDGNGVYVNNSPVVTAEELDDNYYTQQTIDEKEEVIASALTQLNQDVSDIDAKEEVIASALTELNLRVTEDEEVTAAALNDLQENKADTSAVTAAIDAATSGKADTSAVTAVNDALTTHTADTTVHVSQVEKATWNAKADASAITSIESSITAVSNDLNTLSGAVIDNEYTVSQAINSLNNRVTAVESGGSVTVDTTLDSGSTNPVANSAITNGFNNYTCFSDSLNGEVRYFSFRTPNRPNGKISISNFSINGRCPLTKSNGTNEYIDKFSLVETSAITTSMTSSSTDAQVPSAKAVYDTLGGLKLVKLTQAAYSALATKDNQTLYIVVD